MKKVAVVILTILFTFSLFSNFGFAETIIKKSFQDWTCAISKDEMTGKKGYFIYTKSKNILHGWLKNEHLILGYNNGFYVRANNMGFKVEDRDSYDHRVHYARMKVDDGETKTFKFNVWEDNNDGMSLFGKEGYRSTTLDKVWINQMKPGKTLNLEVTLFQTKGRKQLAKFSLMGFTAALNWLERIDPNVDFSYEFR